MKLTIGDRSAEAVPYAKAKTHLRIEDDSMRQEILDAVGDAADFVEGETESTIGTRQITAVCYLADFRCSDASFSLPRGPVQSVASVTDTEGRSVEYDLEVIGTEDRLKLTSTHSLPVTVVYAAGHNPLPGALRRCILHHAAESFVNRGTDGAKDMQSWIKRTLDHYRRTPGVL